MQTNLKTISLYLQMKKWCELTNKGLIIPFSEYRGGAEAVIYDDNSLKNMDETYRRYSIVLDMCVDEIHHDVVSVYEDIYPGVKIYLVVETDEEGNTSKFIEILQEDLCIIIENGKMYNC